MSTSAPSTSIQVSVTINAEPATVWRFLSEQDKLLAWMTYIPGSPIPPGSAFEPRPGGRVHIVFPNGGAARGSVIELDPLRRLVFTWGYDPDVGNTGLGPGACRIEIALARVADGTRVTLTHSGPMTDQLARGHEAGWRHYLSQLAANTTRAQHEPGLAALIDAYLQAWREPDPARRRDLLSRCCDASVRFRSSFGCTDGLEELDAHIANGQKHMPGVTLKLTGTPAHQHGYTRFGWVVESAQGQRLFAGDNFARLTPEGRIVELVGFAG